MESPKPYYRELESGVVIRTTELADANQLEQLQRICFPTLAVSSLLRSEHFLHHVSLFPDGQFVALKNNVVVGMTTTIRYPLRMKTQHTYLDVFDNGFLKTHSPDAEWLYGIDMGTHPTWRKQGIASALYEARQATVHRLGLKGQYTYGMLRGFGRVKHQTPVAEYYQQVIQSQIKDPTVSVQMQNGFKPYGLVPGYVEDPVCDGYCVLLIRVNDQIPQFELT